MGVGSAFSIDAGTGAGLGVTATVFTIADPRGMWLAGCHRARKLALSIGTLRTVLTDWLAFAFAADKVGNGVGAGLLSVTTPRQIAIKGTQLSNMVRLMLDDARYRSLTIELAMGVQHLLAKGTEANIHFPDLICVGSHLGTNDIRG